MSEAAPGLRTQPVLVNRAELLADETLGRVAESNGVRLLAKVGLKDAINVDEGLSRDEKHFALMAHFDFLLVDAVGLDPLLAIEIDGAPHTRDVKQRARDIKKDTLCRRAGLPIVRVNSDIDRRGGRYTVLEYLCEVFFRGRAFDEAQESGAIPFDEPFIPGSFLDIDSETNKVYFGALDSRARAGISARYDDGQCLGHAPDTWLCREDEFGNIRGDAFLAVAKDRILVATAIVRSFGLYGFSASDLAEELAVCDLFEQLKRWQSNTGAALDTKAFQRHFSRLISENTLESFGGGLDAGTHKNLPYPSYRIEWTPTYRVWLNGISLDSPGRHRTTPR